MSSDDRDTTEGGCSELDWLEKPVAAVSDSQTFYPKSRLQHYIEAERLLDEGVKVIDAIRIAGDQPRNVTEIRQTRDDLGKKAMGIWAQAQVHATLANAAPTLDLSKPTTVTKIT